MKVRTLNQNKVFHQLINKCGFSKEEKEELVYRITKGRETSSSKMSWGEMDEAIKQLKSFVVKSEDSADKMRKKIIHYFHELGWKKHDGSADMMQIEGWCVNRSYLKKGLNDYKLNELPDLVSQVEIMYKKHLSNY